MSLPSVTFKCGGCSQLLSIGAELAGQIVRCPYCQLAVQAPSVESAVVPVTVVPAPDATGLSAGEAQVSADTESSPARAFSINPVEENGVPPSANAAHPDSASELGELAPWLAGPAHDEAKTAPPANDCSAHTLEWKPPATPPISGVTTSASVNPWDRTELLDAPPSSTSATGAPAAAPAPSAAPPRRRLPVSVWLLAILLPYAFMATVGAGYVLYRGLEHPVHPLEALQDQGLYEDIAFDGRRRETPPNLAEVKDKKNDGIQSPLAPLAPWMPRLKLGETGRFGGIEVTPLNVTHRKLEFIYSAEERPANEPEALVLRLRIKNVSDVIFPPDDATFNRAYREKPGPYTFLEIGEQRFYGAVRDPLSERLKEPNFGELLPGAELETVVTAVLSDKRAPAAAALAQAPPDTPLVWRVHLRKGREDIRLKISGRVRTLWTTTIVPVTFTPAEVQVGTGPPVLGHRPEGGD